MDGILPSGSAHVVHQSLRQEAEQKVAVGFVRNENTRRTHRAPLTQALPHVLQSFAKAFANALAVCPYRNRTEICLLAAAKRAEGDEGRIGCLNLLVRKFLYIAT